MPALGITISIVVSLRPEKQMRWINAIRDVATVKDIQPLRYLSDVLFIRHTMGVYVPTAAA